MNPPPAEERRCLECGEPLSGRADKKFCNDMCRSAHNNRQITGARTPAVRHIHRILLRNRQILEHFLGDLETRRIPGRLLRERGFDFLYHTHIYETAKQARYFFVFEYGYLPLPNDWYFLVRRKVSAPS
ncbi:MAG: hypothetical protein N2050_02890 [Flavobacteriales bacterium]|nr:hypothetical protein [Flavobacteriales bacterium]